MNPVLCQSSSCLATLYVLLGPLVPCLQRELVYIGSCCHSLSPFVFSCDHFLPYSLLYLLSVPWVSLCPVRDFKVIFLPDLSFFSLSVIFHVSLSWFSLFHFPDLSVFFSFPQFLFPDFRCLPLPAFAFFFQCLFLDFQFSFPDFSFHLFFLTRCCLACVKGVLCQSS